MARSDYVFDVGCSAGPTTVVVRRRVDGEWIGTASAPTSARAMQSAFEIARQADLDGAQP